MFHEAILNQNLGFFICSLSLDSIWTHLLLLVKWTRFPTTPLHIGTGSMLSDFPPLLVND